MTRDGRLGIGIIGAGRVGPVVGAALAGAGHAITGITSGSAMAVTAAWVRTPGAAAARYSASARASATAARTRARCSGLAGQRSGSCRVWRKRAVKSA